MVLGGNNAFGSHENKQVIHTNKQAMSRADECGLWEQTAQGQLSASFTSVSCTLLAISLSFLICIMGIIMGLSMKIQGANM